MHFSPTPFAVTRFLRGSAILAVCLLVEAGTAGAAELFDVYLPDQKNQQLAHVEVEVSEDRVRASLGHPLDLPFAPSSLAAHPEQAWLFVNGVKEKDSLVAHVTVRDGGVLQRGRVTKLQAPGGYVSVDRSGRFFMTAHYGTGAVATYSIGAGGTVGDATSSFKTPNREAHCILPSPDNRFVYIPCVKNNNALFQYSFSAETGALTPLEPFDAKPPAMFGPRHLVYHPTLPIIYFSNEQQLGVSAYQINDDGQLADLQHATTMPRRTPFEQGKRDLHASSLVVTPDGTRLLVAVRDFAGDEDSVFVFSIGEAGKLSLINRTMVGDIPVKLALSPSGRHLIISESGDSRVAVWEMKVDGSLVRVASVDLPNGARDMVVMTRR